MVRISRNNYIRETFCYKFCKMCIPQSHACTLIIFYLCHSSHLRLWNRRSYLIRSFYEVSDTADVDIAGLPQGGGTRYSSTSSLNSITASSPQALQSTSTTSNIHNQAATAGIVCQTQDLTLARGSRESPPVSTTPVVSTPSISTSPQVRPFSVLISTSICKEL